MKINFLRWPAVACCCFLATMFIYQPDAKMVYVDTQTSSHSEIIWE